MKRVAKCWWCKRFIKAYVPMQDRPMECNKCSNIAQWNMRMAQQLVGQPASELDLAELEVVAAQLHSAFDHLKNEPEGKAWDAYARRLFAVSYVAPSIRQLETTINRLRTGRLE